MTDPAVMHGALRHLRRTERRRLYHLLGDRELLARFLADRDETAFEELVTRHGPMVRAVCRRVLGPSADADDAFQATFLVLIRKARSIRKADLLAGWLCAVAYRTARQALRRRSRRGARERGMDELPEPARPDTVPNDWLALFDAALQRLPAKYRDPVVLCELQGLSRRDASTRLGLPEGTLSSRLGRARDLLRRKLDRYGFPLAMGSALAPVVVPEALTASTAAAAIHVSSASVSAVVLCEGVLTAMFMTKLKAGALVGTVVLAVGAVAGLPLTGPASGAGGPPGRDGPQTKETVKEAPKAPSAGADPKPSSLAAEYEPFQGRWEVTAAERDGVAVTARGVGIDEDWTFSGTVLTTGGEAKGDATEPFTVDTRAKPPAIDFVLSQFDPNGTGALVRVAYQGVYRFDPDGRLVICYRQRLRDVLRPNRFGTARDSGAVVVTLRRPATKRVGPAATAMDVAFPVTFTDSGTVQRPAADADLG
jgi:RNA polymerase sigma factor (sigma-70 family)